MSQNKPIQKENTSNKKGKNVSIKTQGKEVPTRNQEPKEVPIGNREPKEVPKENQELKEVPKETGEVARDRATDEISDVTHMKSEELAGTDTSQDYRKKGTYATLMETNGQDIESWYYFIRYEGNEENLLHLKEQLESFENYIIDDLSTFDIDLEHLVDANVAKQMTKLELNSVSFHRKFDGKLKKINFKFKNRDDDEDRIEKVFDILGRGSIDEYVSDEDIDPEDYTSEESGSDSEDSSESESVETPPKKGGKLPKQLQNLPRFALRKRKVNNKKK